MHANALIHNPYTCPYTLNKVHAHTKNHKNPTTLTP